jgi:hypothetical protein
VDGRFDHLVHARSPARSRRNSAAQLALVVVQFDENGDPCTCDDHGSGIAMTVTSSINLSKGSEAGTTVGDFTDPTAGDVRFSLED